MTQPLETIQPATPAVLAWLAAELARGCTRQGTFEALRSAGWQPQSAAQVMALSLEERSAWGVPPMPEAPALPAMAAVPQPLFCARDAGTWVVDGGDRTVAVLQRTEVPAVAVFADLLSAEECDALIEAARPRLSASLTVDTQTGGEALHPDRTSQGMFFSRGENPLVARVEARIATLLGWPLENGEGLQILRYPPGAQYRPHYDYFDPGEPGTPAILQRGGQRVATLIIYLFEPEGGGATVFPDIALSVPPRRGNAVFFSYGQPHPASLSLHGGDPVTKGEKWIATKWLREREFQ
ncbi:MAG: 2OG-Fe(II) oxygenase [Polaromonas sp.]